ncbi:MAG: FtsX-like permease family protein [Myxococcota bacterium]|nr:FtsX-like permease family protein [Myxococcota bacterium]
MNKTDTREPARSGPRPVPFARRLVSHHKRRTIVASAGIGFALLVIFVQLGFYGAVLHTALAVSDRFSGDLMLISPGFVYLGETGEIPKARLFQALNASEVASATPFYFRYANWRHALTGKHCRLFALAFPLDEAAQALPLDLPEIGGQLDRLRPTHNLLLDRFTQSDCGPDPGLTEVEVRGQSNQVVGHFDLGVGFLADGAFITSDDTFSRLYGSASLDSPNLGVLRLQPGSDPEAVAEKLRATLPGDVRVVTRKELNAYQTDHWVSNTAAGNIFGLGSLAGFLVGLVVLFEILSTDIRNQLPFYATLMAMGYTRKQLLRFVLEQAWIFAAIGYLPALLISALLFPVIHDLTQLPVFLTAGLALGVLALGFIMCSSAAGLSFLRLRRADPAELFQ